jgi:adenylosuccinate synthase
MRRLIVLSGPVAAGKSELANHLQERYGAQVLHTADLLREHLGARVADRAALQRAGDRLDRKTGGRWVIDALVRRCDALDESAIVVVDSVRIKTQVDAIREAFGRRVVHLHLTASDKTVADRYEKRNADGRTGELASYEQLRKNRTERQVNRLAVDADIVIDTDRNSEADILVRAATHLRLTGNRTDRLVDVLVGGQYGSEGKGNVASYLAPEYGLLVRSGGPNAGHSVMTDSGKHVQHHLPSGSALCDAPILLTAGAVIYPPDLLEEIALSKVEADRLVIDEQATIITRAHKRAEAKLARTIGSTASGVGAATAGRIMGRSSGARLAKDVAELRPFVGSAGKVIEEAFAAGTRIFVEGTQGTGLSLLHGPFPHVTSRDTTVAGLLSEAGVPPARLRRTVMVCRTYPIRVKNPDEAGRTSGPMRHELTWEIIAERSGLDLQELLAQELTSTTHRQRRVAEFDWALLQQAAALNGPTDLAVTFVDQLDAANRDARRFEQLTDDTIEFIQEVERVGAAPVSLISTRFHRRSIIDRRSW